MRNKLLLGLIAFLYFVTANATLQFGFEQHSSIDKLKHLEQFRKQTTQAVAQAIHTKIIRTQLNFAKLNTYGLIYMKADSEKNIKNSSQWQKIATVLERGPSGHLNGTYDAVILARQDSGVRILNDLNHKKMAYYSQNSASNFLAPSELFAKKGITVQWVKVASAEKAISLLKEGKVDAISLWSKRAVQLPSTQFKTISTIKGLPNPSLYANKDKLSGDQINRIRETLSTVSNQVYGYKILK